MLVAEGVSTSKRRMGILESISLLIPNFHRDRVAIFNSAIPNALLIQNIYIYLYSIGSVNALCCNLV